MSKNNLVLQVNERFNNGASRDGENAIVKKYPHMKKLFDLLRERVGLLMVTPDINEDYWWLRVPVSDKQAIVAFPKFGTVGIGFQIEKEDWNTNLPYTENAETIYEHIKDNRLDADRDVCIKAILIIQRALIKGAEHEN